MKKATLLILMFALLVSLAACGSSATPATPSPTPSTPAPTVEVTPSPTLAPTSAPTPTPEPLSAKLLQMTFDLPPEAKITASTADQLTAAIPIISGKNIVIFARTLGTTTVSTEDFLTISEQIFTGSASSFGATEYETSETIHIGETEAMLFRFNGDVSGPMRLSMLAFISGGHVYQIIIGADVDYSDLLDECVDSIIDSITFDDSPAEATSNSDWYEASTYKVGVDIPKGEYYIEGTSSRSTYICISSDSNGDDILENENFEGHHFITVEDGQYFEINRGRARSVEALDIEFDSLNLGSGMYRVGIDIPPGEYKLQNKPDMKGYLCVFDNSFVYRSIVTNDNFEGMKYVTVTDGQYLLLTRCTGSLITP